MKGKNTEELEKIRHSFAHLLAAAVLELFPDAMPTIGPATENGFFYDFRFKTPPTEADLKKIEKRMRALLPSWKSFVGKEVTEEEARDYFKNNPFKLELIDGIVEAGEKITFYTSGEFTDLCRGGHVEKISDLKADAFELTTISGAYWRADIEKESLVRISGIAFDSKEALSQYKLMLEEAKKRDHRKLAKELDLLVFSDLVGPGMPLFTPKGNIVRTKIIEFSRELNTKIGFGEVHTPNMNKAELFKISGHYQKYEEDMLRVTSHYTDEEYYLKPMNCPQHTQIYASKKRSFRDLPMRFSDFANLYRDEKPGELSGLTRLRVFAQDDGHIFCREDQIEEEFKSVLGVVREALEVYSLEYYIRLSLRDPQNKQKYLGDDAVWEHAELILRELLKKNDTEFVEAEGEAAFYGPKMDIMAKDAIGREWQISTIQLDFSMPERFDLTYTDTTGEERRPVMIHRAIIGSPDRFMGLLIEHFAGKFPLWLSPVQIALIPISEAQRGFVLELAATLREANVRVEILHANDSLGKRIRLAKLDRIPYIAVIGDKEVESKTVTLESRDTESKSETTLTSLVEKLQEEVSSRSLHTS